MTLGWGTLCFSGENGHLPFHTLTLLVTTVAANSATTSAFHQKWTNENPYSFTKWHAILPLTQPGVRQSFPLIQVIYTLTSREEFCQCLFHLGHTLLFCGQNLISLPLRLLLLSLLPAEVRREDNVFYLGGWMPIPTPPRTIHSELSLWVTRRQGPCFHTWGAANCNYKHIHSFSLSHPHTCLGKESGVRSLTSWTVVTKSPHCFEP